MSHAIPDGAHCLLRVMGQQFWIRVTESGDDAMRVSFPGLDYPLEGMQIELELHEEGGYRVFNTHMIGRGETLEEGIVLAPPQERQQRTHRSAIRVDTQLPVIVKDQVSLKKHEGTLINLSQGGALFTTEAPFDFDSTIEMTLTLPGEPAYTFMGQVRHVDSARGATHRQIGIRFISPESVAMTAVEQYIVTQLRALYPTI